MTSYFSQIQYVPDPITGERVNIGVVVIDANGCEFRFVQDWRRAAVFGQEDIRFLRDFADEACRDGGNWFRAKDALTLDALSSQLRRRHNKIQYSEPLPSTQSRAALMTAVAPRILHTVGELPSPEVKKSRGRGRGEAITSAVKSLGIAMREKFGHAPRGLLQRDINLKGAIESHQLDLGLKNGIVYGGAFAVSFETGSPKSQMRDSDAIAFALDDLRTERKNANLSVIVFPPAMPSKTYERARHIFRSLEAPILAERNLSGWASKLVDELPHDFALGKQKTA